MGFLRTLFFIFVFCLFFFLPSTVDAQGLSLKTCATPSYWYSVSNCNTHLNTYVLPCLQGGSEGVLLPDSTWGPGAFGTKDDEKCVDTNGDGKLVGDELETCKKNFSNFMCRSMPFKNRIGYCSGECMDDIPEDASGKRMWEVLGAEFERKYANLNNITPTPTATLAPTPPVGEVDDPYNCINRAGSPSVTTSCTVGLTTLASCLSLDDLSKINTDHSFWQDAKDDYTGAINQIKNALNGNTAINGAGQCVSTDEFDAFEIKFQSAYTYVVGNIITDPPPEEEEEEGNWFFQGTTLDTPLWGVDCGIPDATDLKKRQCCVPIKGRIEINAPHFALKPIVAPMEFFANAVINVFKATSFGVHSLLEAAIIEDDKSMNAFCVKGIPSSYTTRKDPYLDADCVCEIPRAEIDPSLICDVVPADEQLACAQCLKGISIVNGREVLSEGAGIWTGAGCVQTNLTEFIEKNVFGPLLGFAGMAALACIVFSAYVMQTSQGNPEKLQKSQELITSCIMGLILIILSVFVLRVIGVDILRIPGFS